MWFEVPAFTRRPTYFAGGTVMVKRKLSRDFNSKCILDAYHIGHVP
jgi:hypothetical protein